MHCLGAKMRGVWQAPWPLFTPPTDCPRGLIHPVCTLIHTEDALLLLLLLLLGRTWEAHNRVTADGGVGHVAPHVINDGHIACSGVATTHGTQHIIVTRLEGNVEKLAQLGQL